MFAPTRALFPSSREHMILYLFTCLGPWGYRLGADELHLYDYHLSTSTLGQIRSVSRLWSLGCIAMHFVGLVSGPWSPAHFQVVSVSFGNAFWIVLAQAWTSHLPWLPMMFLGSMPPFVPAIRGLHPSSPLVFFQIRRTFLVCISASITASCIF